MVFNFRIKEASSLLNGLLTKQGDRNDYFLVLCKEAKKKKKAIFWTTAWAGLDSSDPSTDWFNIGLRVTREQQGQKSKVRNRDPEGGSQRPLPVLNKSKSNET